MATRGVEGFKRRIRGINKQGLEGIIGSGGDFDFSQSEQVNTKGEKKGH